MRNPFKKYEHIRTRLDEITGRKTYLKALRFMTYDITVTIKEKCPRCGYSK
jgi:hypothetical protein